MIRDKIKDKTARRDGLPELLAPAGSPEALAAAIEAGADAVYLGLDVYSNRMRAKNFSPEELVSATTLCRLYGVKCYLALNVRVFDRERAELERILSLEGVSRVDGIIVADLGLARLIREKLPQMPIHASTQATGVTVRDAEVFASLGFSRMVAARELSRDQLAGLVSESPVETETFIHGAHCVSVSGQCLMSYAMGGRSGNRGECAQPCRMAYSVEGKNGAIRADGTGHPLSLKDMCLARRIPDLIGIGVASLKIEGRQKGADYVRGVTSVYRRLLDERRAATDEEIGFLEKLFSRSGFTDGYFAAVRTGMTGVRPEGEGDRTASRGGVAPDLKIKTSATVTLVPGEPSRMTITDGERTVTVLGAEPEAARSLPLDRNGVLSSVTKTGSTPFSLAEEDVATEIGGDVFITRSALNDLRRRATDALADAYSAPDAPAEPLPHIAAERRETGDRLRIAEMKRRGQATVAAVGRFDILFLPEEELYPLICEKTGLSLPPVSFSDEEVKRSLARAREEGVRFVLAHTLSELSLAKEAGFDVTASARFNVTSSAAADVIFSLGADRITASVELPAAALSHVTVPVGAVVYGRFPVMITARCVLADVSPSGCTMEKESPVFLRDRKGARMPVLRLPGCRSEIFNANPVWMADRRDALSRAGLSHCVYLFTDESPDSVDLVLAAYAEGRAPDNPQSVRRL